MTELWKDTFSNHKAIGFGFHGSDVIVELKAQTKKGGELQENMSGSLTTIHHWYEMNWLGN